MGAQGSFAGRLVQGRFVGLWAPRDRLQVASLRGSLSAIGCTALASRSLRSEAACSRPSVRRKGFEIPCPSREAESYHHHTVIIIAYEFVTAGITRRTFQKKSSTSYPGGNQVDGLPPASHNMECSGDLEKKLKSSLTVSTQKLEGWWLDVNLASHQRDLCASKTRPSLKFMKMRSCSLLASGT